MKKLLIMLMVVAMASFLFTGCIPTAPVIEEPEVEVPVVTVPGAIIDIPAILGVTAPVTGNAPVAAITASAQYTGVVTWSPVATTFAAATAYTATITLTPKAGFTLTGVAANFFTVAGATSDTNSINSGVVTAIFSATTAAPAAIDIAIIPGVTVPVTGATPDLTVTATAQYTGVTTWSPTVVAGGTFAAGTVYTATITLTPKTGFTLTGVAANLFTVAGSTTDTSPINSGVVTAVSPATAIPPTVAWTTTGNRDGLPTVVGETLILTFSIPMTPIVVATVPNITAALAPFPVARIWGPLTTAVWNATNTVLTVTIGDAATTITIGDTITATGFTSAAGAPLAVATATFTLPVAGTTF